MKKMFFVGLTVLTLAACSSTSNTGNSQMYGEVKGGVEHSHTF